MNIRFQINWINKIAAAYGEVCKLTVSLSSPLQQFQMVVWILDV